MSSLALRCQTIDSVRVEMSRQLSEEERACYRGIADVAMTSTMFERLFNVATVEDLIIAQQHGITLRASDKPGTLQSTSSGML